MAFNKEAARESRRLGIIAAGVLASLAGAYFVWSWYTAPQAPVSSISLDRAATRSGKDTGETPEYHALLDRYNTQAAGEADRDGRSFIASMHASAVQPPPVQDTTAPTATRQPRPQIVAQRTVRQQASRALDEHQRQAVDNLLTSLSEQWGPAQGELASSLGSAPGTAGTQGQFSGWTQSVSARMTATDSATAQALASPVDRMLIPAGAQVAAVVDSAVDSDNANSKVVAHVPAGRYAGAQLLAGGTHLAGDGVSVHFTMLIWHNACYKADAWAQDPATHQSSVATDVNNRYFTRIIIPALAHGIGQVGQLYEDANTQILSTEYGEVTANTESPDAQAVTGVVVGGMADKAGQVLEQDAAKLPVKQVTVDRGATISILFTSPVMDSDRTDKSPLATVPQAAPSAPANPAVATPVTPVSAVSTTPQYSRGYPRRSEQQ